MYGCGGRVIRQHSAIGPAGLGLSGATCEQDRKDEARPL